MLIFGGPQQLGVGFRFIWGGPSLKGSIERVAATVREL